MQVVGVAALRIELSSLGHKVEERHLHLVPERTTPATSPSDLTDRARMPYAPDKAHHKGDMGVGAWDRRNPASMVKTVRTSES
jgi:hypothetical protein